MDAQEGKTVVCPGTFEATTPPAGSTRACSDEDVNHHGRHWHDGVWGSLDGMYANGAR
jgi:hypothetical protein